MQGLMGRKGREEERGTAKPLLLALSSGESPVVLALTQGARTLILKRLLRDLWARAAAWRCKHPVKRNNSLMSEITCAFCKGKGKDPFNLLSKLAACQVCGGTGKIEVDEPMVKCAFCKGTGIHPHSRMTCTVCYGRGAVTCGEAKEQCPDRDGADHKANENIPSGVCGGIRVIDPVRKGETK